MPKVLVVDDVADNVELLACELEDQGYEVMKAHNGPEALDVAASRRPDVILLDIMMAGMDGIEVCRRLKADPELRSIPVIMVSALEDGGGSDPGPRRRGPGLYHQAIQQQDRHGTSPVRRSGEVGVRSDRRDQRAARPQPASDRRARRIDQAINFEPRPERDAGCGPPPGHHAARGRCRRRTAVRRAYRVPGLRDRQGIPHPRDGAGSPVPEPERGR